jgi:hypothetical protein
MKELAVFWKDEVFLKTSELTEALTSITGLIQACFGLGAIFFGLRPWLYGHFSPDTVDAVCLVILTLSSVAVISEFSRKGSLRYGGHVAAAAVLGFAGALLLYASSPTGVVSPESSPAGPSFELDFSSFGIDVVLGAVTGAGPLTQLEKPQRGKSEEGQGKEKRIGKKKKRVASAPTPVDSLPGHNPSPLGVGGQEIVLATGVSPEGPPDQSSEQSVPESEGEASPPSEEVSGSEDEVEGAGEPEDDGVDLPEEMETEKGSIPDGNPREGASDPQD